MNEFSDPTVIGPDLTSIELDQIAAIADEIQKQRITKWQTVEYDNKYIICDTNKLTESTF